jgi:hypothetical protein
MPYTFKSRMSPRDGAAGKRAVSLLNGLGLMSSVVEELAEDLANVAVFT